MGCRALSQKDEALAWPFDITDKGIVRTKGPKRRQPQKPYYSPVSNTTLAVIAALALLAVVRGWKDRVLEGFTWTFGLE